MPHESSIDGEATVCGDNNTVPFPQHQTTVKPCVRFDSSTTLQSPCFWILIGAVGTALAFYLMSRNRN